MKTRRKAYHIAQQIQKIYYYVLLEWNCITRLNFSLWNWLIYWERTLALNSNVANGDDEHEFEEMDGSGMEL